ncbi:MAG TPA: CheR family methyltransferase, partial [Longimicrobiaceae bacterium]
RVLPGLARRGGAARCWSAGCASGEEAYTLSMLLRESAPGLGYRVLGTDVVRARLDTARRGRYGRWSLRGVPEEAVARWFEPRGGSYEVRPEVRAPVEFRALNLADPTAAYVAAGAWGMDLVLCRNVLIYLDPATVRHVAERLMEALSPDGWIFLGASDPPFSDLVRCEVVETGAGLAYRRPRRTAAAVPAPRAPEPARPAPAPAAPAAAAPEPAVEGGAEGAVLRVRALADEGRTREAADVCVAALDRYGASAELLYLHAVLLLEARRFAEAAAAARRALYLDRSMIVAHLALGSALTQAGDAEGARRALRNAAGLLDALPAGEAVPDSGGGTAGRLLSGVRAQLRVLGGEGA